jgi:hypothetical protein
MPMQTGVPNEAAPVTAGRQGARARAGGDAAAGELTGSPQSSLLPGGDGVG